MKNGFCIFQIQGLIGKDGCVVQRFLYNNTNIEDCCSYVCPDDVAIHKAYSLLKITLVPVVLLDKIDSGIEESYIELEVVLSRDRKKSYPILARIASPTRETVASYLGFPRPSLLTGLEKLVYVTEDTKLRLKKFHSPEVLQPPIHYHQIHHSALARASDLLKSIGLLVHAKQLLPAVPLARSLYELSLIFYIDWIAPRELYKFLQMATVMRQAEIRKFCAEVANSKRKEGFSDASARKIEASLNRVFDVASRVSEKGKLSPFGEEFHRDFYAFLSGIAHQDYSVTARYGQTLDSGDAAIFDEDIENSLAHVCDLALSAIVSRINEDITP